MIAVRKPSLQAAKRQKRFHDPSSRLYKTNDEDISLEGVEECNYFHIDSKDKNEEAQEIIEIEEELLNNVLMLYEQYEADSLFHRSMMRTQLMSLNKDSKRRSLDKNLEDEKIKCSLLKVFTLLLQTGSPLRGSAHSERMELMQQVKWVLKDVDQYSLEKLKDYFIKLCTSQKERLFPPHLINVLSTLTIDNETREKESDLSSLIKKTHHLINYMEEASKEVLERRLEEENYSQMFEEEELDNIIEVWFVWLQFNPKSSDQLAVWKENLNGQQSLDSLLWNLLFYLSIGES